MKVGDKVRLTLKVGKKCNGSSGKESKEGRIYSRNKRLITIEYINRYGEPTYRESFNLTDIIEKKAVIEVKENREWRLVTPMDLSI